MDWIPKVAAKGWVILTKDRSILVNESEWRILRKHKAKAIFVGSFFDHLSIVDQSVWFFTNWNRIVARAQEMKPGQVAVANKIGQVRIVDAERLRNRIIKAKKANTEKYKDRPQGKGETGRKKDQADRREKRAKLGGLFGPTSS